MAGRWVPLLLTLLAACAPSRAAKTAGQIGCPAREISIQDDGGSSGWGQSASTWTATCRGKAFICTEVTTASGNKYGGVTSQVSCKETIDADARAASPAATAQEADRPAGHDSRPTDAPQGAGGFTMGASADELRLACEGAGHEWTAVSEKSSTCSGTVVDPGFPAEVAVRFKKGRATQIVLVYVPEAGWMAAVGRIRQALTDKYGEPAARTFAVPSDCLSESELQACLADQRAKVAYTWRFNSGTTIGLTVGKNERTDGPIAIRVRYSTNGVAVHNEGL